MNNCSSCSAYTEAAWERYIADVLTESFREQMELHLLGCSHCLDIYTYLIESTAERDGLFHPTDHLTDAIMSSIHSADPPVFGQSTNRPFFRRSTFAHYLIAASITLVLAGSGVFDMFFEGTHVYAAQQETVTKAAEWQQHWVKTASIWLSGLFQNSLGGPL